MLCFISVLILLSFCLFLVPLIFFDLQVFICLILSSNWYWSYMLRLHFGPYSFIFLEKLHCNFFLKSQYLFRNQGFYLLNFCPSIGINYIFYFYFGLYCVNFLFSINSFGFPVLLGQCLFFVRIYASMLLVFLFNFWCFIFYWGFIFIRFRPEILIYFGDHFKMNLEH